MTSWTYFRPFFSISILKLEQVFVRLERFFITFYVQQNSFKKELYFNFWLWMKFQFKPWRSQMLFKIGFLRNFTLFTGKYLCWSLYLIDLQAWTPPTLSKKIQHKCFLVNIAKFFRTPSFYRTLPVAASATLAFVSMLSGTAL